VSTHVAAIDIGTNSVLMLLSRGTGGGRFVTVQDRAEVTRLGQGLDRSGVLCPRAIERTLETLGRFAGEARAVGANMVAVGTSALRDAANASDLLGPAERVLGSAVQVVSGRREALLAYRGALLGLDLDATEITVVDVGGGSTEITRGGREHPVEAGSMRLGAVRLLERYGPLAPAAAERLAEMQRRVAAELGSSAVAIRGSLVAVGGTATTAAAMLDEVDPFVADRVHGRRMSEIELGALMSRLADMSLAERNGLKGLQKGREDVILPGVVILREVLKKARSASCSVSTGGIRVALTAEAFAGGD
jgi:exopolyphosphatase/guanosine-5'-triphosphate,3'-diphosphate pyrophosphatase